MPATGYSGTPLPKKLGIKPAMSIVVLNGPEDFATTLGTLPEGVTLRSTVRGPTPHLIVVFVKERRQLARSITALAAALPPDGMLWVAWPKKASGVPTDMSDETIRGIALPIGLVDTKVCAIDATWSGLKLVLRRQLRP
jgi:hypothetical protein